MEMQELQEIRQWLGLPIVGIETKAESNNYTIKVGKTSEQIAKYFFL